MEAPRVIHKFAMEPGQPLDLKLPIQSKVLHFDIQQGTPTLWIERYSEFYDDVPEPLKALSPKARPGVKRRFVIVATGTVFQIAGHLEHVGTAMNFHGDLVLHCYEVTR